MKFMKMKLKLQHLFLILLGVLVLGHIGLGIKEYFEGMENMTKDKEESARGIPKSQIPDGDEDLYILKSEIVPPVCPKCPDVQACPKPSKCPPCPPCGRCPEPAFECKKVPSFNPDNDSFLPRPVLSDFSQFGM